MDRVWLLGNVSSGGYDTVGHGRVHDSLRLIIHYFTVLVALPCSFVLFERRVPKFIQIQHLFKKKKKKRKKKKRKEIDFVDSTQRSSHLTLCCKFPPIWNRSPVDEMIIKFATLMNAFSVNSKRICLTMSWTCFHRFMRSCQFRR